MFVHIFDEIEMVFLEPIISGLIQPIKIKGPSELEPCCLHLDDHGIKY